MSLKETFERMRTAMEAAGYPVVLDKGKGIAGESWARSIIAYYLYRDRWTNKRIGKMLHRDHSTVTVNRQRVAAALELPSMYDDVNEMIDNFKAKYNELYGTDLP